MERLIELLRHARLKLYEEDLRLCNDQNTVSRLGGGGGVEMGFKGKLSLTLYIPISLPVYSILFLKYFHSNHFLCAHDPDLEYKNLGSRNFCWKLGCELSRIIHIRA